MSEEPKDLDQLISELDNQAGKHFKNRKDHESESSGKAGQVQGFIKLTGFGNKQKRTLRMECRDDQPKFRTIVVQKKVFLNESGQILYEGKQKPDGGAEAEGALSPGETSLSRNSMGLKQMKLK